MDKNYEAGEAERLALKAIKPLDGAAKKIKSRDHSPSYHNFGYGFALDGVRTNGTQYPYNFLDAEKDIREYAGALAKYKKEITVAEKQARELAKLAIAVVREFRTCPSCKGAKGEKIRELEGGRYRLWRDCSRCKGAGVLSKRKYAPSRRDRRQNMRA